MFKKDFILRQFEDFGKVLAKILGLKVEKDWLRFEQEIAQAVNTFTGYELNTIEKMGSAEFSETVVECGKLTAEQVKILARLMFERLEEFIHRNDNELINLQSSKCRMLYEKALENLTQNEFDLDIHYKLEFLKKL